MQLQRALRESAEEFARKKALEDQFNRELEQALRDSAADEASRMDQQMEAFFREDTMYQPQSDYGVTNGYVTGTPIDASPPAYSDVVRSMSAEPTYVTVVPQPQSQSRSPRNSNSTPIWVEQ